MSPFVLSVLKYALLVLLYFFIYRAIKSVALDLRSERRARRPAEAKPGRGARPARPAKGGKVPTSLVVRSPDGKNLGDHPLAELLEVGRSATCSIRLDDAYVSHVHAKLYGRNGAWFVEDMGSTNGTYLNDRKVTSAVEVHAGDRIRIGKTILELKR